MDGLLLDLDGVLTVSWEPVRGAIRAIERLRERGLPFLIVTNTSTRTAANMHARLSDVGFDLAPEEIVTTPRAAAAWLRQQGRPRCRLLVADAVRGEFDGFDLVEEQPDFVVLGDIGDRWSYDLLNQTFRQLMGGATLVALHKGRYWQTEAGLTMDIGAFVAGLEYVSGREAVVVGKPSRAFFELALAGLGAGAARSVMVGDDLVNDVAGAQAAGMRGILVRTGKFREETLAVSDVVPDLVLDSIADLPDALD